MNARHDAVLAHLPMCRRAARRFVRSYNDRDDLVQVASIGLMKAVDRYQPALGPFEPFAWTFIIGELMHHVRDCEAIVRVPRRLAAETRRAAATYAELDPALAESYDFTGGVAMGLAIAALPDRERDVLTASFFGGYTQTEIAEMVGLSQSHVSKVMRTALGRMRTALDVAS